VRTIKNKQQEKKEMNKTGNWKRIGDIVKEWLKKSGTSQAEAARILNVSAPG